MPAPYCIIFHACVPCISCPCLRACRRAEDLLKRSGALDSGKPAADLEDAQLITRLYRLFHGDAVQLQYGAGAAAAAGGSGGGAAPAAAAVDGEQAATAASATLRSRLVAVVSSQASQILAWHSP